MARGASSVAGSATLELERDLRVDTIVGDSTVVDGRFHLLDVDSLDAAHRLGGLLDRLLRGVLPALLGLSQYFNDLQYRHANSSIVYRGIKTIDPETRVAFIVRNQPSGAVHVQRGEVQLPRAELTGIKGDLQAFLAFPQRLIGLPGAAGPFAGTPRRGPAVLRSTASHAIFAKDTLDRQSHTRYAALQ